MKMLGNFVRSFLNINTIWGLMILAAFLMCLAQHYLPTLTTIAADRFQEGENTVSIRVVGRDEQARTFQYVLLKEPPGLTIRPQDREPHAQKPWLISSSRAGAAYVLKWDCRTHGEYELAVGETVVAAGRLVTLQSLTDAAFDYAKIGFELALGLVAAMVLFLGLMKVGEAAGIVQLVARLFHPIIRFLFPEVPRDHPAAGAILMNWTSTFLGLGNAATPFGLKAMKELQRLNPHPEVANDSQVMLLGINTAGLALLPTTLLAVRTSAGCSNPFEIIGTCLVAGLTATITAIIMVKVLGRLPVFSTRAALAESAPESSATTTPDSGRKDGEDA